MNTKIFTMGTTFVRKDETAFAPLANALVYEGQVERWLTERGILAQSQDVSWTSKSSVTTGPPNEYGVSPLDSGPDVGPNDF